MKKQWMAFCLILALVLGAVPMAMAEETYPTYTAMVSVDGYEADWNEMWVFKHIKEVLGIAFEFTQVPADGFQEKKNLAFATGTLPNLFFDGLDDIDLSTYGSQGLLVPLEQYINEEDTPNIVARFEEHPALKAAMTFPDGHIYNFRGYTLHPREQSKCRFWVNVAWMDQLGIEEPTTLDEFYNYLKLIKENDLNGNGDATDEVPLSGRFDAITYVASLELPILAALGYTEKWVEAIDGEVVFVPTQPLYKEYLAYMNKLYSEGLLDAEYFTQTAEQYQSKQAQGVLGGYVEGANWLYTPDIEVWRQYDIIEPMTSEFNSEKMWPARDVMLNGHLVITTQTDEEGIKDLMRLADYCYDFYGSTYLCQSGPKQGEWDVDPEYGWIYAWDEAPLDWEDPRGSDYLPEGFATRYDVLGVIKPNWGTFPGMAVFDSRSMDRDRERLATGEKTFEEISPEQHLSLSIIDNTAEYYRVGWPTTKFTAEESDELGLIKTDLYSYVVEMEAKMITGETSLDSFDEFVAGCNARGAERYAEIYQDAYDRWVAANES